MNFSLIICTYNRISSIKDLMKSIQIQTLYPNQILIIDGSTNDETNLYFLDNNFSNLQYFKVNENQRGLTKQRNFGIEKVDLAIDFVCFLDDDVVLEKDYFEQIQKTYLEYPQAFGVGGYITNDLEWKKVDNNYQNNITKFSYDGFITNEGFRFKLRRFFGLDSNLPPGFMPLFSHGRSVSFLPPSREIYSVEQLMGGVSSFKKEVLDQNKFSTFFEGYGLYEDADFTIRISKKGQLYLNTNAKLAHYHHPDGRPNQYNYGKMVVTNGWYIWRVKNPNPKIKDQLKWHFITLLLMSIRGINVFNTSNRKQAFTEFLGRFVAYIKLFFVKPKIQFQ